MSEKLLTEDELTALATSMAKAGPFTETQFHKLVRWAERVRLDAIFLSLILHNEVGVSIEGNSKVTLHSLKVGSATEPVSGASGDYAQER